MKRQGSTELPRFAVGALAIVGASAANAATVQITFNGSYISTSGGNQLVSDFGGDGDAELYVGRFDAGAIILGVNPYTFANGFPRLASAGFGEGAPNGAAVVFGPGGFPGGVVGGVGAGTVRAIGGRTVTFSDASIRGGASTIGYLDITASASATSAMVTFNRLIFDEDTGGTIAGLDVNTTYATYGDSSGGATSAVPEASTSLGLLALGAGGILTRRRSKRAA